MELFTELSFILFTLFKIGCGGICFERHASRQVQLRCMPTITVRPGLCAIRTRAQCNSEIERRCENSRNRFDLWSVLETCRKQTSQSTRFDADTAAGCGCKARELSSRMRCAARGKVGTGADSVAAQRLRAARIGLRKFCALGCDHTGKAGQFRSGTLCASDGCCYLRFGLTDGSVGRGTVAKRCNCNKELL